MLMPEEGEVCFSRTSIPQKYTRVVTEVSLDCHSSPVDPSASIRDDPCLPRINPKAVAAAFGTAIREKRHALNLSQEELAARCGLHRTYLADVERGERNPSLVSILRIASGLGVPASDLMAATETHLNSNARRA